MDRISKSKSVWLVIVSFEVLFILIMHIKCKGSSKKGQLVGKLLSLRSEIRQNLWESQWL